MTTTTTTSVTGSGAADPGDTASGGSAARSAVRRAAGPASAGPPSIRLRRLAGWAAIAGTLPYLVLKVLWLTGHQVGIRRPDLLDGMDALNAVTVAMDACVIALALALAYPWGRRLPAWLLLLPAWVGGGFLIPMAVVILPSTVLWLIGGGAGGGHADPMEAWVRPMVYGGFAWQGVFLAVAFVLYARDRWPAEVGAGDAVPGVRSREVLPLLRVLAGGGTVMVVLTVGLSVGDAIRAGTAGSVASAVAQAAMEVAGLLGVLALARDTTRRVVSVAAGWIGTGVLFAWGLWGTVNMVAGTPLAASGYPMSGLAGLAGLLGGFALAVAGLLAVTGTGVVRPPATVGAWEIRRTG